MTLLLRMEGLRFVRNPINLWVIAAFALVLIMAAVEGGLSARAWREQAAQAEAQWHKSLAAQQAKAAQASIGGLNAPDLSALAANNAIAPSVRLTAQGGLALSVPQFDLLSPEIHIDAIPRSRHTDGRNSDQIFNPLLREIGALGFSTLVALLLPLAVIGLGYGLVHEEREQGIWRLVCAQTRHAWAGVFAALGIRFGAVLLAALIPSLLALALDPGATLAAAAWWAATLAALTFVWVAIVGVFTLLPVSSGAGAVGMLGVWLALTFAVPAGLEWAANLEQPMPSRLATVIDLRKAMLQTEAQQSELLAAWYRNNPAHTPAAPAANPPWQQVRLPRYLAFDATARPMMATFDEVRASHFTFLERLAWLSPGLAAVLSADRLAGIDAPRYLGYIHAVNGFEDEWRAFFVPRIMSNQKLAASEYDTMPRFSRQAAIAGSSPISSILRQILTGLGLLAVLVACRFRINRL